MKIKIGQFIFGVLTVFLFVAVANAEAFPEPQEMVETATNNVLAALQEIKVDEGGKADAVNSKVIQLILPHLDFVAMSKLVLAKHWRQANVQQREQFVEQFRNLLVRTYETSLMKYRNEKISFLPFRESDQPEKKAVVRSEVIRSNGPSIPMNYSLRFKPEDGWKVYDIGIEGISLVTNYRSSFSREISQHGIDHLIESLRVRNSENATGAESSEG